MHELTMFGVNDDIVLHGKPHGGIFKQKTTKVETYLVMAISLIPLFVYVLVASFLGFSLPVTILAGLCASLLLTNRYYELFGL